MHPCRVKQKRRYLEECLCGFGSIKWKEMLFGYHHFSKYNLCSAEEGKSYRFGNDIRVNDDFFFF